MSETDKVKQPTLLDWIKNIEGEHNVLLTEENERSFSPFIVNRVLARNQDTLIYAYQLNMMHYLDKKMQYLFLHKSIPKKPRYGKWGSMKGEKPDEVEAFIMRKYSVNLDIARQYIEVHTAEQIKEIKSSLKKEKSNGKK